MSVLIIDYGSGNLHSAAKSFLKAGARLERNIEVTSDPDRLNQASHIVLPGVGAFADCLAGLKAIDGMIPALTDAILKQKKPFFGICVGMQLMFERGLEHGIHAGLGWIKGEVVPITPQKTIKIPHMGWNNLQINNSHHPIFAGLGPDSHAYFVHSYHATCADPAQVLATVDYGGPLSACIGHENMVGTQFHPEKSQAVGLKLIENFLKF